MFARPAILFYVLSGLLAFLPAASLCAEEAPAAPVQEEAPPPEFHPDYVPVPEGMLAEPYQPAPSPGIFTDAGAALGISIAEERHIELDPDTVRDAQDRILLAQQSEADHPLFTATNRFTLALNRWHAATFRWMDNTIRSIDLRWSAINTNYNPEISTFVLAILARAGGRSDDHRYDAKARFRADLELPGLERRLKLVADNIGRDELPDTDPMKRESDFRVGVQSRWDSFFGERWDLGGGLRLHSFRPVGYVDLEWVWSADLLGGQLRFDPRGVWYTDDGFGQDASLSWTSSRDKRTVWQLVSAETVKESTSGIHLEETVRLGLLRHAKGCGWVFQASVFPHIHEEDHTNFDDFVVNATWRDTLYQRWIYYSVTAQVDFADEDDHEPKPSLRIGIDILFGRETRSLL